MHGPLNVKLDYYHRRRRRHHHHHCYIGGGSVRTTWLDTGLRSLLVSGSWEPFPREKIGWSVKLTTQPYQVPRFRIIGAMPPVFPMLSWKFVSYFTLHDRLFHAWVALNFVPKFHQVVEHKAEFFCVFFILILLLVAVVVQCSARVINFLLTDIVTFTNLCCCSSNKQIIEWFQLVMNSTLDSNGSVL